MTALKVLGTPALARSARVSVALLAVALFAGAIRLLPSLLGPGAPLSLAWPMARGYLGLAMESTLLFAAPLGFALTAAHMVDRGEARALAALGVGPGALIGRALPAALGIALALGLVAELRARDGASPGRGAGALLAAARSACVDAPPPAVVDVPLVGLSWVCMRGVPPRVVGRALRTSPVIVASAIEPADDLRAVTLRGAELLLPSADHPALLRVGSLDLRGLTPLVRPSRLPPHLRSLTLVASLLGAVILASWIILAHALRSRAAALVIGGAGPAASLGLLAAVERSSLGSTIALLACAGVVAAGALAVWLASRLWLLSRR